MAKFIYTGKCAAGFVEFRDANGNTARFEQGVPTEAPDFIAGKLATNGEFTRVKDAPAGKAKGRADDAA